ncbi:hypothetical protein CTAYLR_010118 [Chrysophaeum taylorii]|uniref:D-lactate dehydrogenase (cytochrome) n=1 Tax=Chrysophaeum taylorii TaxID=2483200 RepID=A0AAD7XNN2_9STRA|nr:hypothetical protein CTAYLR_010118 [Chrysophaeum taylorii]
MRRRLTDRVASQLERICTTTTNAGVLHRHGKDESHHECVPPEAVVFPSSTAEVQAIVRACADGRVPLIAYGTGTSLEGHIQAVEGGVCVDTSNLSSVLAENPEDFDARCEAGATRKTLNASLRHAGLAFMVDPGADASLGGMAACGASGTMAVRYGTMRENVLGLTAVVASGDACRFGGRSKKSSAGYDLTSLFVGSEGTLGIITDLTVKIHPVPPCAAAAKVGFETVRDAADSVVALLCSGLPVQRCELLDAATIAAFNLYNRDSLVERPTLFLEFADVSADAVARQLDLARDVVSDGLGQDFQASTDEHQAALLWKARHSTYYAALALKPNGRAIVPLSAFADCVDATVQDIQASEVVGPVFGHAGDGNFHAILVYNDDDDRAYLHKLHAIHDRIVKRAIDAGGTCTGEHGVGVGKRSYLGRQFPRATLDAMAAVKAALDPLNIMNPGKILPPP